MAETDREHGASPFRTPYPDYRVLEKWASPSFNEQTRRVVADRLENVPERRFFDEETYALLRSVIDCILPQPERSDDERIPVEAWIDAQLEAGKSNGTRYAGTPTQREAFRRGLAGIDHEARHRHGKGFRDLSRQEQHALLKCVDEGDVDGSAWKGLEPKRFFRSILLKEAVKIYYAHPAAWNEMGFGGPAAPRGYLRLGPDDRDPWEAREDRAPQKVRGLP
ncbi:gluconate 2-dehydrogenase subunit 3 family protein [Aurantimonas sp. VKM B-3413]|uniref:gluconate 2-dehydrogenase subunit 3 family protein n=1 Tax=Aurantimonas sp. VKM B-3413 TaxID=2779401 RepID=UPI001E348B68|nr:gluconate 2-dehydrogenase subunit 3 family protein [Aurantimonas sp. VKM B-3413]MCB8836876.1 gluconate 2-dehydrogenase subunit 3 family protein [Aurantimonas sp. VKM B-3413]